MGDNIICALVKLYCRSGCSGKVVAAALAFHPPNPPFYTIDEVKDAGTGDGKESRSQTKYKCELHPEIELGISRALSISEVTRHVHTVQTKSKSRINVMFFLHPEAKITVLYSHGNATDIGAMNQRYLEVAMNMKVNVCGYDYSGYGGATGSPTEKQVHLDAEAALAFLNDEYEVPPSKIVVYGESVGSGPTTKLATKHVFLGCVLHAPLKSGLRVLTPNRLLCCCDIFPNIDLIRKVKCPVWVVHGLRDQQINISHGKGLHENVPDIYKTEPYWVPGGGHNNLAYVDFKGYFVRFNRFLQLVTAFYEGGRKGPVMRQKGPVPVVRQPVVPAASGINLDDVAGSRK